MNLATEEKAEQEAARVGARNAKLGGTDIFRGALVIVTAIVIGGFVISRGLGGNASNETSSPNTTVVDISGDQAETEDSTSLEPIDDGAVLNPGSAAGLGTATTVADQATEAAPDTAPAAPILRSPAEVKVLVLNGAQTQGIAARGTEALLAASYKTAAPKNARNQRPSAVLYVEGYEAEALAVAAVFGPGLEGLVQPLDPADLPIDDTQESSIIVILGPDNLIPLP